MGWSGIAAQLGCLWIASHVQHAVDEQHGCASTLSRLPSSWVLADSMEGVLQWLQHHPAQARWGSDGGEPGCMPHAHKAT